MIDNEEDELEIISEINQSAESYSIIVKVYIIGSILGIALLLAMSINMSVLYMYFSFFQKFFLIVIV